MLIVLIVITVIAFGLAAVYAGYLTALSRRRELDDEVVYYNAPEYQHQLSTRTERWEERDDETRMARLRDDLEPRIRREVESELRQELEARIRRELEAEVRRDLEPRIRREVEAEVRQELEARIRREVEAEVRRDLEPRLRRELEARFRQEYEEAERRRRAGEEAAAAKRRTEFVYLTPFRPWHPREGYTEHLRRNYVSSSSRTESSRTLAPTRR